MSPRDSRLNDADLVAQEYASEERFLARRAALVDYVEGPSAEDLAFEAIAEGAPDRVLEAGAGTGACAERVRRELGADVTAVDLSPRMVELAGERGVPAIVADVRELPFGDEAFDCAAALWVLHHVPDLDRGLGELARVLEPGGRLVAVAFGTENLGGEAALARHFGHVERRDADGTVAFPDRAAVQRHLRSLILIRGTEPLERLPQFDGPFRARSRHSVFVAEKTR